MSTALPTGLAAKLEVTATVDWLTYAHVRSAGQLGLGAYLGQCYGINRELDWLEISNDSDHRYDLRTAALDAGRPYGALTERATILAAVAQGYVQDYNMATLLTLAMVDGFLPPAVYVISMSW